MCWVDVFPPQMYKNVKILTASEVWDVRRSQCYWSRGRTAEGQQIQPGQGEADLSSASRWGCWETAAQLCSTCGISFSFHREGRRRLACTSAPSCFSFSTLSAVVPVVTLHSYYSTLLSVFSFDDVSFNLFSDPPICHDPDCLLEQWK